MITNASMGLGDRNQAAVPLLFILGLIWVAVSIVKANLKESQKKTPTGGAGTKVSESATKAQSSASNATIDNAAKRIRKLASDFEDKSVEILFTLNGMKVERVTQARSTEGRGNFQISKTGFQVAYYNLNSKAQKPHVIEKRWNQIAGCLPNEFDLFFGDNTALTITPVSNLEDCIFFRAAWQGLNSAMNGGWDLFREPETTNIGKRLRQTADYIQANSAIVIQNRGAFNLDEIGIDREDIALTPAPLMSRAPSTGDKIGKWVLGEKLGGPSGQGAVYRAQFEGKGETFAIKVMQWSGNNPKNNPIFHKQATSLMDEAKLSMNYAFSPFILGAIDYGLEPWPWVCYPLIQGKTISTITRGEGPFEGKAWWDLAHDLLSGLALVHKDGLIHRDIKSDNVMILDDHAIILDFGLSEVSGYLGDGPNTGFTLNYAAPEVLAAIVTSDLKALETLSPALDIYSAGILLYFARTGALPWKAKRESAEAEMRLVLTNELGVRVNNDVNYAGFTPNERQFIEVMLRIEPSERPKSGDLLAVAARYVDLEAKAKLIEEGELARVLMIGEPDFDPATEIGDEFEVKGPFASWKEFKNQIKEIVEQKKPRYFIFDFDLSGNKESTYVQVMKEKYGWHAECMSERFAEVEHSTIRKTTFAKLGWTPPTGDSPNYMMDIREEGWEALSDRLVDALEQGFGISPSAITTLGVTLQGLGYYK